MFSDIEENDGEWEPAVLNNQTELDFIRIAQKGLSHDRSYWIGGSTNSEPWSIIDLNDQYNIDSNAGNLIVIFLLQSFHCMKR